LVDITAQNFVVNFVDVNFALARQKVGPVFSCLLMVVGVIDCLSFLTNDSSVSNNGKSPPAVGSVEGAGGVVDSGNGGSEGLGLGGRPVLSLVRLRHGLVGHLTGSTVNGGSVDGGVDNRSSVDNRAGNSVDNGSSVDNGTGNGNGVGNSVGNGDSLGVGSLAVVGDSGDVSLDVVGSVGDVLGAAVRESNGVRSSPGSGAVVSLSSLEVGAGVVVGNGVLVLVGGDLVGVHLGNGVGNGVGNHRGVVSGGSVDNRGSVDNGAGDSVGNGGSVDDRAGNSVSDNSVGESVSDNSMGKSVSDHSVGKSVSNDTVGNTSNNSSLSKVASKARLGGVADGIGGSDGGNWGTEALGLAGAPHLTLERLGDGLVRPLASGNNGVANMAGQQLGGGGGSRDKGDAEECLHVAGLILTN